MKLLTYSSLYPNNVDPTHGIFVERRLRELLCKSDITADVVAPVPWFPFGAKVFGKYSDFSRIARRGSRYGINAYYPRYPVIPKIGMYAAPWAMARCTLSTARSLLDNAPSIRLIDAHYFYPDGVAASYLSRALKLPFIVTARGSDINTIAQISAPRKMILAAANAAEAVIAVSQALADSLQEIGVASQKIHVLPNGVDLSFFNPGDRQVARAELGFKGTTFISVGSLKEAKGHDIAIESLHHIAKSRLVIIGSGPDERRLRIIVKKNRLQSRVIFAGQLDPEELRRYYQAADALFLISKSEGMPNVVLESIACGTPVLATNVGGIREILNGSAAGCTLPERSAIALADTWERMVQRGIERKDIREDAQKHSWDPTINRLHDLVYRIAAATEA